MERILDKRAIVNHMNLNVFSIINIIVDISISVKNESLIFLLNDYKIISYSVWCLKSDRLLAKHRVYILIWEGCVNNIV